MVLNVEKQREVAHVPFFHNDVSAAMAVQNYKRFNSRDSRSMAYRSNNSKKEGPYCDHCKSGGHTKDSCFKLIGYPEWYWDLKKQRSSNSQAHNVSNVFADLNPANTPLEANLNFSAGTTATAPSTQISQLAQEVLQAIQLQNLIPSSTDPSMVNIASTSSFAGFAE
ncbi:uncharacterized protein LOC110620761 [Manihot esculenta]|uniref:uncharacterized protein LOC110620761 n=1 Tax=Manihot esculenta TaxID=3983 RepID=UPI000B5D36AD|nr:uncharacterized protein LOC110620761 [Manihot esculenta]